MGIPRLPFAEAVDGTDSMDGLHELSLEATAINQSFSQQVRLSGHVWFKSRASQIQTKKLQLTMAMNRGFVPPLLLAGPQCMHMNMMFLNHLAPYSVVRTSSQALSLL